MAIFSGSAITCGCSVSIRTTRFVLRWSCSLSSLILLLGIVTSLIVNVNNVLRLPPTRSPEYPPPLGWNASYDIGLLRWGCPLLVQLCSNITNRLVYPCNMTDYCEMISRQLTELHVDRDTGIMVYANTTFHSPHRHFSHLLAWLPLHAHCNDRR